MHDKTTEAPRCHGDEECTSGSRNRYFLGKRLTPAAFASEQRYHLERRRLLNRAIHGWGVVYGLAVAPAQGKGCEPAVGLEIGAGLALDRAGRELVLTRPKTIRYAQVLMLDAAGRPQSEPPAAAALRQEPAKEEPANVPEQRQRCWLLAAHYAERRIDPVTLKDDCHCERREWDQVCEELVFTLSEIDCKDCCKTHHCELCCDCVGDCELPLAPHNRGPHRCLCRHLSALQPEPAIDTLCELRPGLEVDLHNGVALACVSLKRGECGPEFDQVLEACGPRRLVKRNDLLFDLIRGCDLTVIDSISWANWHRLDKPLDCADFAAFFSPDDRPPKRCVTKFWLRFSRPVQRATLRPDCFAITVVGPEEDSGWGQALRVPIIDLEPTSQSGDPPGHARAVALVVDGEWVLDELKSKRSIFRNENSLVEIEVRGDFILDCNGQAVDANAVGLRPAPTGNGTPGGTFRSTFTVAPAGAAPRDAKAA